MRKSSVAWLTLIVICIIAWQQDVVNHEDVHYKIFRDYGIPATVDITLFGGSTRPDNPDLVNKLSADDFRMMEAEHIQNEIVDYNTVSTRMFLMILVVMFGYGFCQRVFPDE